MNPDRLRHARIAADLTQDEVVAALAEQGVSLTKGGLSKYERGGSTPKPTLLRSLARVLGVETSYFFEAPATSVKWLAFRKADTLGRKRQERIKALAESQVEAFVNLHHALHPSPPACRNMKPQRVTEVAHVECIADKLRDHWGLGRHPIDSVTSVIEDAGGIVVESGGENDQFDGLSGWTESKPRLLVIVVSWAVSDDRRRFSLAHELGHLFMTFSDIDEKTRERWVNRFAAAFLVPAETARRELGGKRKQIDLAELEILKKKHGLSMQAWLFRAADLEIIPLSYAKSVYRAMIDRGQKVVESVAYRGDETPRKLRQLALRARAEGLITQAQAHRICPRLDANSDSVSRRPLDARSLMRMSREDREQLMEQAAAQLDSDYRAGGGLNLPDQLAEEDHFDESLPD